MSNRKYPRLADGYHDRSQYPPYQTSNKYSKNHSNCDTDGRERDRSPVGGASTNNRGSSPYCSRHSNSSPRSHRSKSYVRSRESGKRGSSKSPSDANTNSHGTERHSKPNHASNDEAFIWSQHVSSSGKVYYYNSKTEKSQWEKPREWIERERRDKERKEKEKRDLAGAKEARESFSSKESALHREHMVYTKPGKYISPSKCGQREYHSSSDKRDGNHTEYRLSSNDHKKEAQRLCESDKVYSVIKTCSAHTAALSTVVHRSTPVATVFGGETTVSPVGSVQDVSPPTTPSSRVGINEPSSHTPSPNVATSVSPHVAQLSSAHSPQLHYSQQSPQFLPSRHGVPLSQSRFPQVTASGPAAPAQHHFTQHQFCGLQQAPHPQINNYRQYPHVSSSGASSAQTMQPVNSAPLSVAGHGVPSPRPAMQSAQMSPQPTLHPLQQATLVLQQRKLSEAQAAVGVQKPYTTAGTVHSQQALSTVAGPLHVKDDRSHQSSPGSPVVFAHAPPKEQMSAQLYHNSPQLASISAAASPIVSSSSHSCSLPSSVPAQQQSTPSVNLQAVAKYVDKNLANHVSGWPTDIVERQLQKLWDDTSCHTNDGEKAKIEQLQLQAELGFMELRLETASKRISSLKGLTRTLEVLLAESDAKFLS